MNHTSQSFDEPPALGLEEAKRVFSAETFQRLFALVAPHLADGKRTLIYVLPASSRFAHMALEPWALYNIYGQSFEQILVIIRDRRLLRYGAAIHRVASTVVKFIETTSDQVIKLGHFDAPPMENGPLTLLLQSPQMLFQDLFRHLSGRNEIRHLEIPENMRLEGDAWLNDLGVRDQEPVVAVHMREDSYLRSLSYNSYRVTTPAKYEPALRHLLDKGYRVFRLGDPSSSRLTLEHPRFVDLPFLDGYRDFMDLVLLNRARFAVCCTSGPEGPTRALGTPMLLVNAILDPMLILNSQDLLQPKTYLSASDETELSYEKILFSGAVDYSTASAFEASGVLLEENTPDELLAAVKEMEARLDGTFVENADLGTRLASVNTRYALRRAQLPKPQAELDTPHCTEFGFSLPWVKFCQAYSEKHPNFISFV